VASGDVKIVPDIQVGAEGGGVIGGLGALLMRTLADDREPARTTPQRLDKGEAEAADGDGSYDRDRDSEGPSVDRSEPGAEPAP